MQIFFYSKFITAGPAEHSFLIKIFFWPNLMTAAACSLVAFKAREIIAAAIKFDCDAVDGRMIMEAAGFLVNVNAFYW